MTEKAKDGNYFLNGGKVYIEEDQGLFTKARQIHLPERKKLFHWNKAKLSEKLWFTMLNFFLEGYELTKSENLVYLYYSREKDDWLMWVPPQQYNGMTVESDNEHPDYVEIRSKDIPAGYIQLGTIHHHCSSSAFASNVDKDDEQDREGLHFTIGFLQKEVCDVDCRAVFHDTVYEKLDFTDFVECKFDEVLPIPLLSKVKGDYLKTFSYIDEEEHLVDPAWHERCTKKVYRPANVTPKHIGGGFQGMHGRGNGWGSESFVNRGDDPLQDHWDELEAAAEEHERQLAQREAARIGDSLKELTVEEITEKLCQIGGEELDETIEAIFDFEQFLTENTGFVSLQHFLAGYTHQGYPNVSIIKNYSAQKMIEHGAAVNEMVDTHLSAKTLINYVEACRQMDLPAK